MFKQQISKINSQRNGQGKTGVMYETKNCKGETTNQCYSGSYKPGSQGTAHRKIHKDINEQRPQQVQYRQPVAGYSQKADGTLGFNSGTYNTPSTGNRSLEKTPKGQQLATAIKKEEGKGKEINGGRAVNGKKFQRCMEI